VGTQGSTTSSLLGDDRCDCAFDIGRKELGGCRSRSRRPLPANHERSATSIRSLQCAVTATRVASATASAHAIDDPSHRCWNQHSCSVAHDRAHGWRRARTRVACHWGVDARAKVTVAGNETRDEVVSSTRCVEVSLRRRKRFTRLGMRSTISVPTLRHGELGRPRRRQQASEARCCGGVGQPRERAGRGGASSLMVTSGRWSRGRRRQSQRALRARRNSHRSKLDVHRQRGRSGERDHVRDELEDARRAQHTEGNHTRPHRRRASMRSRSADASCAAVGVASLSRLHHATRCVRARGR
jgi:hypothetical protein